MDPEPAKSGHLEPSPLDPRRFPFGVLVALTVVVGALLRGVEAGRKSLWLDEFHSLFIAAGSGFSDIVERVRMDFHPPLYYLWLHLLDGVDAHALRSLSILASLATLVPLLSLARTAGLSPLARFVACGVFCTAPYQLLYGAELRAYSILQLATLVLVWAAFTDRATPRTRFYVFTGAAALGLYHHYFTAVAILAVGAARLVVRTPTLLRWRSIVAAGALGVVLFMPWIAATESWIFTDPGVMFRPDDPEDFVAETAPAEIHGGFFEQDFTKAAAVVPRTFVPMLGSLGPTAGKVAFVAAGAFFGLVTLAFLRLALAFGRGEERQLLMLRNPALVGTLGAGIVAYTLTLFVCLFAWRRVPEQYFVVGAWLWPFFAAVLVDAFASRPGRRGVAAAFVALSLVLGVCHAWGTSREDMRAGIELALREGRGRDALYTCLLWQPDHYSDVTPLEIYAPDVPAVEPRDVPPGSPTVIVITRKVNLDGWRSQEEKLIPIRDGRELVKSVQIDEATWVHVFEPADGR